MAKVLGSMKGIFGNKGSTTVKTKYRFEIGSKRHDLYKKAQTTLGRGDLRIAVQLPEGEDVNEWLALQTVVGGPPSDRTPFPPPSPSPSLPLIALS